MKKVLAVVLAALSLGACSAITTASQTNPAPLSAASSAQATAAANWERVCLSYNGLQTLAINRIPMMPVADVQQIVMVTKVVSPLCEAMPTNPTDAVAQITAAIATLTAVEVSQKMSH